MHERFRRSIERRMEAKRLFRQGTPITKIAGRLGVSHGTVSGYIWGRARQAAEPRPPNPKVARAKELKASGAIMADIQRVLGVSRATLYRWLTA